MKLLKVFSVLMVLSLLLACTDSATENQKPPLAPPNFVKAEDPKVFFANYLADLSGDRFLPPELFKMLAERTRMSFTVPLFKRHNPYALLEWYYSDTYLQLVRERVNKDLQDMDYQLQVMDIPEPLAAKIMMVGESGPIEHKRQLLNGGISETWKQFDENRYEVRLTNGNWSQLVGIGLENGVWKLRIF